MLRFEKITIHGFKDIEINKTISFSKEPISVIYGKNGSGKTTLLEIIHAVLDKNEKILLREKVRAVELTFSLNGEMKEINITKNEEVFDEEDGNSFRYNWSQFEDSPLSNSSSILFGVNRGTTTRLNLDTHDVFDFIVRNLDYRRLFKNPSQVTRFSDELVTHLKSSKRSMRISKTTNINFDKNHLSLDSIDINIVEDIILKRYRVAKLITTERVQAALFETLSLAINPISQKNNRRELPDKKEFMELISENREKLLEALQGCAENALRDDLIEIMQGDIKEIFKLCLDDDNLLFTNLIYNMILELKKEESILISIDLIEEIFREHTRNKKIVVEKEKIYIDLGKGATHKLSELSSGERHLLTFLAIFLIEGRDKGFLMIDEPELSLNINWQRKLLDLLKRLVPNAQIIVASHSPSLSKANLNYLVELV